VKISNISIIVLGVAGLALGGCHLYNNDQPTGCAGYIGCSATEARKGTQIGLVPDVDGGTVSHVTHAINKGCGMMVPDGTMPTIVGKPNGYTHFTVMATGATLQGTIPSKAGPRTFWVRVPADYDPNHKYRLQYVGQGCGGYGVANTSTIQFFKGDEEVIYVALDIPTDMANQDCYDNRDGPNSQEWEAFQLFQEFVDSHYCVDNNRVYISGYSTGGWLTDMWGCYFAGDGQHPWNGKPGTIPTSMSSSVSGTQLTSRANVVPLDGSVGDGPLMSEAGGSTDAPAAEVPGGSTDAGGGNANDTGPAYVPTAGAARAFAPEYHIRAQMGISGGEPDNNPPCNGPVAAIWIHDLMDGNAYAGNFNIALPRVLRMNSCGSTDPVAAPKVPWHEDIMGVGVCKQYTGCPKNYPVVFCTTDGQGHADQHGIAIPGYAAFANEMEAAAGLQPAMGH
jgi:poly(3-hydroxybutyrate) depolymerase